MSTLFAGMAEIPGGLLPACGRQGGEGRGTRRVRERAGRPSARLSATTAGELRQGHHRKRRWRRLSWFASCLTLCAFFARVSAAGAGSSDKLPRQEREDPSPDRWPPGEHHYLHVVRGAMEEPLTPTSAVGRETALRQPRNKESGALRQAATNQGEPLRTAGG